MSGLGAPLESRLRRVVILAFDGSVEMSIAIPRDMFSAANRAQQKQEGLSGELPDGLVSVATQDGQAITTFSGSRFHPDLAIDEVEKCDLVIVSGVWSPMEDLLDHHGPTIGWLRSQYEQGTPLASMHAGAFLLAEAGLLDNRPATIYWRMEDTFQSRYPKVILQPERKITAADQLYCSAGVGSGLEMSVYLIERIFGIDTARKVSKSFLMDIPRETRDFQLVFDRDKAHSDQQILDAQQWLELNYSHDFMLDEVAERVGLGLRSFTRRFKKATGSTPMNYLQRVRFEAAKELLGTTSLSVDQIGYRVGYADGSYFNRLFKMKLGKTPGEFRKEAQAQ